MSEPIPNAAAQANDFEFQALAHAHHYRRALLREFSPFLKGDLIEVGAGIGQFTELLIGLDEVLSVTAIEPSGDFCAAFRARSAKLRLIHGISKDLPPASSANAVVSINVLEHIELDEQELSIYAGLLCKSQGALCLFVPARHEIYAPMDEDFGHFRRYSKPELRAKLDRAGFEVLCLHYFNLVGYFLWWVNFCLLKKRSFEARSVSVFDRLIFPVTYAFERHITFPPIGQSLLVVARPKPARS